MPRSCHRQGLRVGDIARAAGFALLVGFGTAEQGRAARGGGWARRGNGCLTTVTWTVLNRDICHTPPPPASRSRVTLARPPRVSHLQAGYSRYAFPSPGPRSEPAVGEYRDSGPGLLHRIKIKVGEQQAGLRTQ
jgi:hypothetical protein